MRRIPSLSALRAFDAAARRLHFADAANELGLTPGAVSRQIQQLETNLGVKLFDRDSRTVKLTEMGKTYAADIASALDSLAFASDRIRAGRQHKPLRICAYPTFALRWLIPRWREFFDLHPDIDLQLTTSLSQVDPQRDGFDAVVRLTFPHQFEKDAIVLAPPRSFRSAVRVKRRKSGDHSTFAVKRLSILHRDQMIGRGGSAPQGWMSWYPSNTGRHLRVLNLSYQAALEGPGVAMGVGCLVEEDLRVRRLIKPLSYTYRSKLSFCMIFAATRTPDQRVTTLRDFLVGRSETQDGTTLTGRNP